MSRRHKNKTLLCFAVYIFIVCLLQVACELNGTVDDPESNPIDPDKFRLDRKDLTKKRNFVVVSITPGSSGMMLGEFFVTVSLEDDKGIVRGSSGRNTKGLVYDSPLDKQCLEKLFLTNKQSECLGKDDTCFKQGKQVSFKIEATPNTSVKEYDRYTLTVKVEREGSNPHTETTSIVLTAKQNGVGMKEPTAERNTAATNSQTLAATLGTVSSNTTPLPICHPTLNEAPSIPTERATTQDTNPSTLIPDTHLPATPNREMSHTSSAQITDPPDSTTAASSDKADTSAQQSASSQFTFTPHDATRKNSVRNFVLVTIKPGDGGMTLKDFLVTASFSGSKGIAKGSNGQKGKGFVYNNVLDKSNLEELFLTNQDSKCLGKDDTHFAQGGEVEFRIEVKPGDTVRPGDQYVLTVEVAYTGSNPHTVRKSIVLTAVQGSPSKGRKRTNPRK